MSASLSRRNFERRASTRERRPLRFVDRRVTPQGRPRGVRITGKRATKREFMVQARLMGFRGRSFRKAKRFERALDRAIAAAKVGAE